MSPDCVHQNAALQVDFDQARQFIEHLTGDGNTPVTYQTFSDSSDVRAGGATGHTRILHGPFADHAATLVQLNESGAGIFVVVNETDLRGRRAENIMRVQALFVDFDNAGANPLKYISGLLPEPHIVVESSPGKAHAYWRVSDCKLGEFTAVQAELAARLGGERIAPPSTGRLVTTFRTAAGALAAGRRRMVSFPRSTNCAKRSRRITASAHGKT